MILILVSNFNLPFVFLIKHYSSFVLIYRPCDHSLFCHITSSHLLSKKLCVKCKSVVGHHSYSFSHSFTIQRNSIHIPSFIFTISYFYLSYSKFPFIFKKFHVLIHSFDHNRPFPWNMNKVSHHMNIWKV